MAFTTKTRIILGLIALLSGFAFTFQNCSKPLPPENAVVTPSQTDELIPKFLEVINDVELYKDSNLNLRAYTSGEVESFEWSRDGLVLADQTTDTLQISEVELSEAGSYQVIASNSYGSTTSNIFLVKVLVPDEDVIPTITQQPLASVEIIPGEEVTLSVMATGFPAPRFQWYLEDEEILDATSENLVVSEAGNYHVMAINRAGSETSPTTIVTVTPTIPLHHHTDKVFGTSYSSILFPATPEQHTSIELGQVLDQAGIMGTHAVYACWARATFFQVDTWLSVNEDCSEYSDSTSYGEEFTFYVWDSNNTAGTRKALYQCKRKKSDYPDIFTSLDSNCNGENVIKILGFIHRVLP